MIWTITWFFIGLFAVFVDGYIKSADKKLSAYIANLKSDQRIIASAVIAYISACATLYAIDGSLTWQSILLGVVCKDYMTTAKRQIDDPKKLKAQ